MNKTRITSVTTSAFLYVKANVNNTILTLTNDQHAPITQLSCGSLKHKNARKNLPYAIEHTFTTMFQKIKNDFSAIQSLGIIVKGMGAGRDFNFIYKEFSESLNLNFLEDRTMVAFGGPKKPRRRRV